MKATQQTAGATLIVTVLIVMLVMAAILAVTAQITLSSRRSSADQENTLRAQYAAESGVARSQAGLNLLNALMTNDMTITTYTGSSSTASSTEVAAKVAALCGLSGTLPASGMLCGTSTPTTSSESVLGSTADLLAAPLRLSLFTDYIDDAAYAARGWTLGSTASTNEQAFWANALGSAGLAGTGTAGTQSFSSAVRARVAGVQKLADDQYVVYFTVPIVRSQGGDSVSTRAMTVDPVNSVYTLLIGRGSFAKYALFTNHHFSSASAEGDGNRIFMTSNTRFSGPVHTNQQFTFIDSPYFGGQVTSAGCPAGKIKSDDSGCSVAAVPGAYGNNTFYKPNQMTATPPTVKLGSDASPQFQGGVDWNANYVPLPENGNDQKSAARSGGLFLGGQVTDLALSVNSSLSLGGVTKKAQVISYQRQVNGSTVTVNLAYGSDGRMFIQNAQGSYVAARKATDALGQPTGAWEAAPAGTAAAVFNGVVYAESGIGNLRGPARTSTDNPDTAPAAVADFAQMTVASDGNIAITSDLKYENPPCTGGDAATAVCNNTTARNILGIYSAGGDVKIVNRYDCTARSSGGTCTEYKTRSPAAPKNVTIQAVLMAAGKEGKVTVEDYDAGPANVDDRGRVNLLGGIIENYYGAFGLTNGKGYGRNFVYDTRTGDGIAPPSFPTQKTWDVQLPVGQRLQLQGSGTQQARP